MSVSAGQIMAVCARRHTLLTKNDPKKRKENKTLLGTVPPIFMSEGVCEVEGRGGGVRRFESYRPPAHDSYYAHELIPGRVALVCVVLELWLEFDVASALPCLGSLLCGLAVIFFVSVHVFCGDGSECLNIVNSIFSAHAIHNEKTWTDCHRNISFALTSFSF